jgi:dTDP-4-amino-4,6-dideoxygalactose transaminase
MPGETDPTGIPVLEVSVPFLDLEALHAPLQPELTEALTAVIEDNAYILGPAVQRFEESFASYVGRDHCVGVSSGTAALHLALLVAGVGPGDEVITTPHTWISTTWAISYCGAVPVFADVDAATGNLDPAEVEKRFTDRTRAVLPVDLYGNPSRLDEFTALARGHDVALVDDACQAHGSQFRGRPVGSYGSLACFSFYPGKNLGAFGEGGAIVTDDADSADRLRRLRDHAQRGRHQHDEIGFNYRMDGLQGAVLAVKLKRLDEWNAARRRVAASYVAGLSKHRSITLPTVTVEADPNWHQFVIRVADRDAVRDRLTRHGIETMVHYPVPVHLQKAYEHLGHSAGDFPHSENFASTCLSLPISPVITPAQQEEVVCALIEAAEDRA